MLAASQPRRRNALLCDDTLLAEMDARELGVAVHEAGQRDRSGRSRRATSHLGNTVFEAVRQIDTRASIGAGHRIFDRLADHLENPGHPEAPAPGVDIDAVFDRAE